MSRQLFSDLDRLLRGDFYADGRVTITAKVLVLLCIALGAVYGVCMGLFAALRGAEDAWQQVFATVVKVPGLFLMTLVVTLPSLYVFSALHGSRLRFKDTLRLLLVCIGVNLAVLASFGPVTAFFTASTDSYPFMIVLNVIFFTIAGVIGLGILRRAMEPLFSKVEGGKRDPGRTVFGIWTFLYGVVGAQMAWIMRPFVGAPGKPFEWFRERQSNFFEAVLNAIGQLFGG